MDNFLFNPIFPFVYLDSSWIIRNQKKALFYLTKKSEKKDPHKFFKKLEDINIQSQIDSKYYSQIISLQRKNIIDFLITGESFNNVLINNSNSKIIQLFGAFLQTNDSCIFPTLWNQKIDYKKYNKSVLAISQATNIVVDANALEIPVYASLLDHASSTCNLLMLDKQLSTDKIGKYNASIFYISPEHFIHRLSLHIK